MESVYQESTILDRGNNKMQITTKAIETVGTIRNRRQLVLDEPLPIIGAKQVRIIILIQDGDISE
jgi:hypothetical protein